MPPRGANFPILTGAALFKVIPSVKWRALEYPITIAELKSVSKDLDRLLSEVEKNGLVDFLACNPEIGDIMPGTGGIRKMRWPCASRGKSSGLRVIYYFHDLNMPLYLLAVYGKGEILRLTKREEREMATLVKGLVRKYAKRNQERLDAQGSA
jgi:mRNA-degrading endonuclease RelE of RelBE toxin-antitoxin system